MTSDPSAILIPDPSRTTFLSYFCYGYRNDRLARWGCPTLRSSIHDWSKNSTCFGSSFSIGARSLDSGPQHRYPGASTTSTIHPDQPFRLQEPQSPVASIPPNREAPEELGRDRDRLFWVGSAKPEPDRPGDLGDFPTRPARRLDPHHGNRAFDKMCGPRPATSCPSTSRLFRQSLRHLFCLSTLHVHLLPMNRTTK